MKIEKISATTLAAAAKLHAQTFKEIGESLKSGKEIVGDSDPNQHTIVALEGKKVVGYAVAYGRSRTCYFGWLGVAKARRNRGLAQALGKSIESWAKRNKSKSLMLDSRNRYKSAIRLYLRMGYDIVGTWENHDGEIMIRLRKDI